MEIVTTEILLKHGEDKLLAIRRLEKRYESKNSDRYDLERIRKAAELNRKNISAK